MLISTKFIHSLLESNHYLGCSELTVQHGGVGSEGVVDDDEPVGFVYLNVSTPTMVKADVFRYTSNFQIFL